MQGLSTEEQGKAAAKRVRKNGVVVLNGVVSLKRLYFAASIATTILLLNTAAPADAVKKSHAPTKSSSKFARTIVSSARAVASSMSSVGYCYRGVKRALRKVGVELTGGQAFMAKRQLERQPNFRKVPMKNLQPGDILVHGKSRAHPHGHIAVYLGNGKEASDHIGRLVTGRRYGGTTVFRAVNPTTEIATAPRKETKTLVARAPKPAAPKALAAKSVVQLATAAPLATIAAAEQATKIASASIEQKLEAPTVVAEATAQSEPAFDLTSELSVALLKVVEMAQSAHINLTNALAEAVGAITS